MTNYRWLYKFVLEAVKHPDSKLYREFVPYHFLAPSKDWGWNYEYAKTDKVHELIKLIIENGGARKSEIKRICKELCKNICFYEEFEDYAKYLTKKYKRKEA